MSEPCRREEENIQKEKGRWVDEVMEGRAAHGARDAIITLASAQEPVGMATE